MRFIQSTLLICFVLAFLYIFSNFLFSNNTEIAKKDSDSSDNVYGSNSNIPSLNRSSEITSQDSRFENSVVASFQDAAQPQPTGREQENNDLEPRNVLSSQELLSPQYTGLVNNLPLSTENKDKLTLDMLGIVSSLNSQITVGDITQEEYQRLIVIDMEDLFTRYLTDEEMSQFYEYEIETDQRLRGRNELASGIYSDNTSKIPGLSEEYQMSIAIIMAEEHMVYVPQAIAVGDFKGGADNREEIVNLRKMRSEKIVQRIENLLNGSQLASTLDYLYENHHMVNIDLYK